MVIRQRHCLWPRICSSQPRSSLPIKDMIQQGQVKLGCQQLHIWFNFVRGQKLEIWTGTLVGLCYTCWSIFFLLIFNIIYLLIVIIVIIINNNSIKRWYLHHLKNQSYHYLNTGMCKKHSLSSLEIDSGDVMVSFWGWLWSPFLPYSQERIFSRWNYWAVLILRLVINL